MKSSFYLSCTRLPCKLAHKLYLTRTVRFVTQATINDPYKLLKVEKGSTKIEIRQAYISMIKQLHPDLNPDSDTTQQAIAINKAYKELILQAGDGDEIGGPIGDVFDERNGEVSMVFVNPFACFNVDPMRWRELQQLIEKSEDIESTLSSTGISFQGGAINYLTWDQYEEIQREMMFMERTLSFETTAWYLGDCLSRSQRINNMMS